MLLLFCTTVNYYSWLPTLLMKNQAENTELYQFQIKSDQHFTHLHSYV